MRSILLILVACFLVAGLSGCCGSQAPTMQWQPFPSFAPVQTTPVRTINVPYTPPAIQYAAPAAPAYAAPCN